MDLNNYEQESHPETEKDTQYQQAEDSNESEEDQITPESNQALSRTPQEKSPSLQSQKNQKTLKKTKERSVEHSESNEQPTAKKRYHPLDSDERDQIIEEGGFAESERVSSQNLKVKKKVKPSEEIVNHVPDGGQMEPTNCINLLLNQKADKLMKLEQNQSAKYQSKSNPSNLQTNQQIDLEIKRQTAELSLKCYKLISKEFPKEKLKEKSFHDNLIEMINETKFEYPQQNNGSNNIQPYSTVNEERSKLIEKYSQEIRKPFKNLFENGIKINKKIFTQRRIEEGSIEEYQEEEYEEKFIFHPTYFIANQIFKELHNLETKRKIMTGQYGISKTVSVCLFWHLVRIIDEYRFEKNAKVTEEMRKIPKMVYWSIPPKREENSSNRNEFIIDQFPEVKEEYKLSENGKYEWAVALEKFHKKFPKGERYSRTLLVLDQINEIASIGREHKETIKKIRSNKVDKKRILSQCELKDRQEVEHFEKMGSQINTLEGLFTGVLYLSSMDIEPLFQQQVPLAISKSHKHEPIETITVNYFNYMDDLFKLIEIIDYFMFEISMRIFPIAKYDNKVLTVHKEIRNHCIKFMQEESGRDYFLNPYYIRKRIEYYATNDLVEKTIDEETNYVSKMKSIFEKIVKESLLTFRDHLRNYFEKNEGQENKTKKINLTMKIYNYLNAQKAEFEEKEKANKDKKKENRSNMIKKFNTKNKEVPIEKLNYDSEEVYDLVDKKLINHKLFSRTMSLLFPADLIISILEPLIWENSKIYLEIIKDYLSQHKTGSYQGNLYENHFHFCVQQGNVTVELQVKKETEQILKLNFSLGNEAVFRFKPLSSSNLALLKIFENTIKNIIDHNKDSCVVFPSKESFLNCDNNKILEIDEINSISKCIDIVFIENSLLRDYDKIRIWLFDLTVQPSLVYTKLKNFLDVFLKFSDRNINKLYHKEEIKVEVNYFVITPNCWIKSSDVEKDLNRDFVNKIIFKGFENSRYLEVESLVGSENCILKTIGWIDPESEVKFESNDNKVKEKIKAYEEISKQIFSSRRSI